MLKLNNIQTFSLICFILLIGVLFYPHFGYYLEGTKLEKFATMSPGGIVSLAQTIQTMEQNINKNLLTTVNNEIVDAQGDVGLSQANADAAAKEVLMTEEAVKEAEKGVVAAKAQLAAANAVLEAVKKANQAATANKAVADTALTAATTELTNRRGALTQVASILTSGATAAATAVSSNPAV